MSPSQKEERRSSGIVNNRKAQKKGRGARGRTPEATFFWHWQVETRTTLNVSLYLSTT
jgi:hypothetical protein